MADKDLLAIIADILRKMDQHEGILDIHTKLLERQGEAIERQGKAIERQGEAIERQGEAILKVSDTLITFMDVSIKHFEKQQDFNERFLASSQHIARRLDSMEATLNKVLDMETRLKRLEEAVFK